VRLVLDGTPPARPAGSDHVFAYGSPATAAAAERLRRLLSAYRADGVEVRAVSLKLPCCGADIRRLPDQFWRIGAR